MGKDVLNDIETGALADMVLDMTSKKLAAWSLKNLDKFLEVATEWNDNDKTDLIQKVSMFIIEYTNLMATAQVPPDLSMADETLSEFIDEQFNNMANNIAERR